MKTNFRHLARLSVIACMSCLLFQYPATGAGMDSGLALPPCFSDNMVMEPPSSKNADEVCIWGWARENDKIYARFGSASKWIRADMEGNRWFLYYKDLKYIELPREPFEIRIEARGTGLVDNKKRNMTNVIACANVVLGEVWAIGQQSSKGVALTRSQLERIQKQIGGRVRLMTARSANWSTNSAAPVSRFRLKESFFYCDQASMANALPSGWQVWNPVGIDSDRVVNVTAFFIENLMRSKSAVNPAECVGIIVFPTESMPPFITTNAASRMKNEWSSGSVVNDACYAVASAVDAAATNYAAVNLNYSNQMRLFKREGKVQARTVFEIVPPNKLLTNNVWTMPYSIHGSIW